MANANITKNALAQSLKELGSKKNFDKITVADISDQCGVNRQTFYYHFADKYELLNWIYNQEIFTPLTSELTFENWPEKWMDLFRYMKNNKKFLKNTIGSSNNYFEQYMEKSLVTLFEKAIDDLDPNIALSDAEKNVYANFFAYGLTGVVVDWVMKGMKESEEEFVKLLQKVVFNTERLGYEMYLYRSGKNNK